MQAWRAVDDDAGFFIEFARQGGQSGFVLFDAAAWKVPTGPVGMADEKDVVVGREDAALRAERQGPGDPPISLQKPLKNGMGTQRLLTFGRLAMSGAEPLQLGLCGMSGRQTNRDWAAKQEMRCLPVLSLGGAQSRMRT